ncbi:MAG: hypothetical protein ACM3SY_12860 [Candidatus Omnitrophota bacterium]
MRMLNDGVTDTVLGLSKQQAGSIFDDAVLYVKSSMKKRIDIYEPLDFNTTYHDFLSWIKNDDLRIIREKPDEYGLEHYLDGLIKNFLIEKAYFALEIKYIKYRMMKEIGVTHPNDIRLLEIVEFITDRIEKDELNRLKKFEEKCKFKTFLSTVISRLLTDFWREKFKIQKNVTKYEPEFYYLFNSPQKDPLDTMIDWDYEKTKTKASKFLSHALNKLDFKEKLTIKLKYEQGMNVSGIARTLGYTRYKTEQFIEETERKVSLEIVSDLKKGGSYETPGRPGYRQVDRGKYRENGAGILATAFGRM